MVTGKVHSFETFGAVDGPGIRFVVFLKGCAMRCKYCHNPDTWKAEGAQEFSAQELLDKALRYKTYWKNNGGITVSGGEALLQIDFLIEFFQLAKAAGVHTALDTSGQPFSMDASYLEKFNQLMEVTDLFILDIKHMDQKVHEELTGHTNQNILELAKYLSEHKKDMWIRHVFVPGLTDKEEDLIKLKEFVSTLESVKRFEVLPYHTFGIFKWEKLGMDYSLKDVKTPAKEEIDWANKILETQNFSK
ncbi:pyruvate formate-lyase-activating protein [[Clostridium] polysaccharolyticum]|uniref:Pyruvate formate-lyase-activating enzyme n=2 Tax=[Clostridium] polysaccharolyticum TaxID=29364 RepID=A0A1I0C9R5_9FIRM|nr:pyruvate formate-lyase-activating protein [[Clostridium] polysaccharolyticum]SET15852.1 pyruvate formate lyase activating enzyme [[Clostridium] polysaccharolyticum]